MKDLERKIQELTFDVETQYCDPSDCFFDCYHDLKSYVVMDL